MHTRGRATQSLALLALSLCAAATLAPAFAQDRAGRAPTRAPDAQGRPEPVESANLTAMALVGDGPAARAVGLADVAWTSGGVTCRVAGRPARLAFRDTRAILFAGAWQPWAAAPALAEAIQGFNAALLLRNGERLTGHLAEGSRDAFRWESPILGPVIVPLDSAALIVRGDPDQPPPAIDTWRPGPAPPVDEVLLINGDRLAGRVEMGADAVAIRSGGDSTTLPFDRIGEIRFAALPPVRQGGALAVWLADGTLLRADAIEPQRLGEATALRLVTDETGRVARVPAGVVAAITSGEDALLPLAEIDPQETSTLGAADGSRVETVEPASWSGLAALGARDLVFAGPSRTQWRLPAEARLLMGRAILPEKGWRFGDSRLTIWINRAPAFQATLSRTAPETFFAIPLEGGEEAIITLQPGGAGDAQAIAILQQPVLLLAEPSK